jgi:manganese/iron transport system permease protein
MTDAFILKTYLAIALVSAECGLIGVFVFLLNIPFVGVAVAHMAMAGGIWGIILNFPSKLSAFIAALAGAAALGPLSDRVKINPNISLSIIFSAAMGFAFLGVGLTGSGNAQVAGFLWGNIFLVTAKDIWFIAAALVVTITVIAAFYRQYLAILFNREIAASIGVNEKLLYYSLLLLIGAVIAVNLEAIGGLMLFSLVITPPAIAYQVTFNLKKFFIVSALSGIAGGCGGLAVSYLLNWPVSASVVLFTSFLFVVAVIFSPKRFRYGK